MTEEFDAVYAVRGDLIHLARPGARKTLCGRVVRGGGCLPLGGVQWCQKCDGPEGKR